MLKVLSVSTTLDDDGGWFNVDLRLGGLEVDHADLDLPHKRKVIKLE